ncbi:hypothetical protein QKW52_02490 [Bacillus sonorensis]|nr:hypothetical protein [Bacillus sonorensis]
MTKDTWILAAFPPGLTSLSSDVPSFSPKTSRSSPVCKSYLYVFKKVGLPLEDE